MCEKALVYSDKEDRDRLVKAIMGDDTEDDPALFTVVEEAIDTPFCPLQEKFHTFVLRGL